MSRWVAFRAAALLWAVLRVLCRFVRCALRVFIRLVCWTLWVFFVLLVANVAFASAASAEAAFEWPLPGTPTVDRVFDPPDTPWGRGHRGVDLRAEPGDQVLAAGAGRVTYAGRLAGRGVVTVTHDGGLRTTYEPVDARVRVGQRVRAGAVLGLLGTGHASCRPGTTCLHWGLLRGDTYLDPLALVRPWRVRLLPLGEAAPSRPRALPLAPLPPPAEGRVAPHPEPADRGAARPSADDAHPAPVVPGTAAVLALTGAGALVARRRRS